MKTYSDFLEGLQLKHFTPPEIRYRGGSDEKLNLNGDPPPELWGAMVETARVADMVRAKLGAPLRIISGFRNAAYNKRIGGASQSYHMRNKALDLTPVGVSPRKLFNALSELRAAGAFKGGLGLYDRFVHIDTRGSTATWGV